MSLKSMSVTVTVTNIKMKLLTYMLVNMLNGTKK
jgi:hypothetical protein